MFAQNIYRHIKVPLFVAQSLYDIFAIRRVFNLNCLNRYDNNGCGSQGYELINQNRNNISLILSDIGKNPKNGAWGVSCVLHGTINSSIYLNANYTVQQNS